MTEKLVIIGNGMAPGQDAGAPARAGARPLRRHHLQRRAARQLRPHHAVAGAVGREELSRRSSSTATAGTSTTASRSTRATRSSRSTASAKTVTSDHGVTEPYDKLVIATGSVPFIIPVPGNDLPGVLTYRDLDDVNAMLLAAQSRAKAVVIGGGLLGLEAAAGLEHARHGRDRAACHADADGAPARPGRRLPAAARRRSARHQGHHQGQHQGDHRQGQGRGCRARRRHGRCPPRWW